MADDNVTMTASLSLGDGFLMAAGDLFGLSSNSPAKLAVWRNPDTDLATYTTVTFPSDGTYNSPIGMRATANGAFLYIAFRGYDNGTRWKVRIIKLNTADLTYADFVLDDWGDSGVVFSPGAGDLCLSATHLYFLNHADITFGDAEVRKYLLADGSVVAAQLITGRRRGHPIQLDSDTGLLFFAGTDFANGWCGWMDPANLTSYDTANIAASITVEDDFVIRGNYLWFLGETSNPAKIFRVKKDLSTVDTLVSAITGTAHGIVANPDDNLLLVGVRDANRIATFNPDTLVEGTPIVTSSLVKINDLVRSGTVLYASTFETTSHVGRMESAFSGGAAASTAEQSPAVFVPLAY